MNVRALILVPFLALGCTAEGATNADRGGVSGTETPVKGVVSGPDGELSIVGTQPGTNSTENGQVIPVDCSEELQQCEDICTCLGINTTVCDSLCESGVDVDVDVDGGNRNGNNPPSGVDDFCNDPSLTACEQCACDNTADPTVCINICLDASGG